MRTRARLRTAGLAPALALTDVTAATPVPGKFSADVPWRGPMLGDSSDETDLLIAVACDPGIGSAFGVACVPLLDTEDKLPHVPARGHKNGVGLGDGEKKVKQALRESVIWVPKKIHSTTPLLTVTIPIGRLDRSCSRLLPLLISHLAPLDGDVSTDTGAPGDGAGIGISGGGHVSASGDDDGFKELWEAALDGRLGIPPGDVGGDESALKDKLVDCIFDLIDPAHGDWTRFESIVLHRPAVRDGKRPEPTNEDISFFLASCLYPAGLFDGTPRYGQWPSGPADASLCRLARMLDAQPRQHRPTLLILTGDQIYADASAGLFDARLIDDRLHFGYERLYLGRGATEAFARIVPAMLIDDHEIRDNWEPEPPVPPSRKLPIDPNVIYQELDNCEQRNEGVKEYWKQERCHWRPLAQNADPLIAPIDVAFTHDGADFRLVNTRTQRDPRNAATIGKTRIVRPDQMRRLRNWLTDTARSGKPRFIDTPSVFLPRHRVAIPAVYDASKLPLSWASTLRSDAWDGYPRSQHALLAFLVRRKHENVVFLSGDEHVPFVTWARVTDLSDDRSVVIRSIHSSPLYAPFPFSNADPEDLAGEDEFRFELGDKTFLCRVETEFFTCCAGFAKVRVAKSFGGAWEYRVDFFGEHGVQTYRSCGDDPWLKVEL